MSALGRLGQRVSADPAVRRAAQAELTRAVHASPYHGQSLTLLATIALRNTPLVLTALEKDAEPAPAIALVGEGFDMLEEDLEKERFFALVRRTYWQAAGGSPTRHLMQTLIGKLDF